jgi:hypothetical protein
MKILIVIGTRPNFIKVTQFKRVAKYFEDLNVEIVHTGQHFDTKMADVFFEQFELIPDYFLNIPVSSANKQMAEIMIRLEDLIIKIGKPDLLMVVGDVNSTLAAALCANKLSIKIAHLESGLRSKDYSMPEEINRILTDKITNYFFVTEQSGEVSYCFDLSGTPILVKGRSALTKAPSGFGVGIITAEIQLISGESLTKGMYVWIIGQDIVKQTIKIQLNDNQVLDIPETKIALLTALIKRNSKASWFKEVE